MTKIKRIKEEERERERDIGWSSRGRGVGEVDKERRGRWEMKKSRKQVHGVLTDGIASAHGVKKFEMGRRRGWEGAER